MKIWYQHAYTEEGKAFNINQVSRDYDIVYLAAEYTRSKYTVDGPTRIDGKPRMIRCTKGSEVHIFQEILE